MVLLATRVKNYTKFFEESPYTQTYAPRLLEIGKNTDNHKRKHSFEKFKHFLLAFETTGYHMKSESIDGWEMDKKMGKCGKNKGPARKRQPVLIVL